MVICGDLDLCSVSEAEFIIMFGMFVGSESKHW